MRSVLSAFFLACLGLSPLPLAAQDRTYVPDRRLVLTENTDFAGGDIQQIFDTTLEACEQACLADDACTAFTFNSRAGSCFPKTGVDAQDYFEGAYSGWVRTADAGAAARASSRAVDLNFLADYDFDEALRQAQTLANEHITGDFAAEEHLQSAADARASGDLETAARFQGAALNLTDAADQWVEYGQLLLDTETGDTNLKQAYNTRALTAAINAYLRADSAPVQTSALVLMARAFEVNGRGASMIPALRLAQGLQPRDDTAAMLDDAIGKYGFNITENSVQNDFASPRICAVFNQPLAESGVDYATFVKLDETGLSVEASGQQICVAGVTHGKRYAVTFREGLPSATGEELAKDIALNLYVRDRSPAVRFSGRAYILPRLAGAGIPVETVNAQRLTLTLQRISDRNLVRSIQNDYFARPLDYWQSEGFNNDIAEQVWQGEADVAMEVNRDVTTRLPMDDVLADLGSGIYALQAAVPGRDPYDFPPATQWFVISDLGLTTMSGTDGLHVFVRGLSDAAAKPGVTATLVSRSNAIISTVTTDDKGYANFPAAMTQGAGGAEPALVTVEEGEDFAFLSLTDPEFDLSDRGVAGREASPPIDVFLTTDRGAYRAGETVNATILARDPLMAALEGLPMTVRLLRPDGVEYSRQLVTSAGAGGYAIGLPIGGGAPRGTWRIESFVEEETVLAGQSFLVEDFLPERIDFTLTLPEGPISLADAPEIAIDARYLFGAPGADLGIEGDLRISAAPGIEGFDGYSFGRHDEAFSPFADSLSSDGATDAEGKALAYVSFPDLGAAANRPLEAAFAVRLIEGSGRPVERRITRTLLPAAPVIGVKPAFDGGVVPQGTDARFDVVAVGPDAKAADQAVHWTVNRLETDYQWYSLYGQWNWEVTTTRTRVAEGDATLTATGSVTIAAPVDWGQYEVLIEATDGSLAATSMEFYAGWYAPADAAATPDTLELSLDKPAYKSGETATLRLVPRAAGTALVTVVSNRLIDMQAVPVTAGENTIPLTVTDEWGAGAYVTASVIRPLDTDAGRSPVRALGLSYAPVDPGDRKLTVAFETAPEADPRGPLPVALKVDGVAPGETAYATIAAVDVGILNLTGFTPPDPEGHYFGQRKLGIGIRDIYGRLIDSQNGALGTVRSGGDAGAGMKMQSPPPTEELVAYFSGPITVGPDGYARTDFTLPSFNGTVKLMAVAWSEVRHRAGRRRSPCPRPRRRHSLRPPLPVARRLEPPSPRNRPRHRPLRPHGP